MSNPLPYPPSGWVRPVYPESSQGVLALILGILSVVALPLAGPFAWYLGRAEVRGVDAGRRDPSGRGPGLAGYVLGVIGTVMLAMGALILAVFVAFGLAFLLALPAVSVGVGEWSEDVGAPPVEEPEADGYEGDRSDAELREEWLAAAPRDPSSSGSSTSDAPDRCDLVGWFEDQLSVGQSSTEIREAVGEPDSVRQRDASDVWLWNLGVCSFIDYDSYELVVQDEQLVEWRYVPG
jgi:hypothetical protein